MRVKCGWGFTSVRVNRTAQDVGDASNRVRDETARRRMWAMQAAGEETKPDGDAAGGGVTRRISVGSSGGEM